MDGNPTKFLAMLGHAFGLNYPIRYALGFSGGLTVCGVFRFLASYDPANAFFSAGADLDWFYFPLGGLTIAFILLMVLPRRVPEAEWQKLDTIEDMLRRGNLTKAEQRTVWRNLANKYVDRLQPFSETETRTLEDLVAEAEQEVADGADDHKP